MVKLEIHVFDPRIMNIPGSSYDAKKFKKMSQSGNIYPFKDENGNYLICMTTDVVLGYLPRDLLFGCREAFKTRGGCSISRFCVHTSDALPPNEKLQRWLFVFAQEFGKLYGEDNAIDRLVFIENSAPTSAPVYGGYQKNGGVPSAIGNVPMAKPTPWGYEHDEDDDSEDDDDEYDDRDLYEDTDDKDDLAEGSSMCIQQGGQKSEFETHGVLVTGRKAIKHDRKIIRAFLKEFFPGDKPWVVRFRAEIEDRWVDAYVVAKGDVSPTAIGARMVKRGFSVVKSAADIVGTVGTVGNVISMIGRDKL